MRKLLAIFLTSVCTTAFAQSTVSTRINSGLDVGAAFKKNQLSPSLTYYELLNLDAQKIFSLGYTFKAAAFYGNDLDYLTAPAKLTRGKSGFGALGTDVIPANIDTMRFNRATVTSLNLGIRAQVRLGPLELGAGADLLGLSFGKSRSATYFSSTGQYNVDSSKVIKTYAFRKNQIQYGKPGNLNLRLLGDNNFGTLATEVYARLRINQRVSVKAGYQWLITEMRASHTNTVDNNNRFRNRTDMTYVALTFPFFR